MNGTETKHIETHATNGGKRERERRQTGNIVRLKDIDRQRIHRMQRNMSPTYVDPAAQPQIDFCPTNS